MVKVLNVAEKPSVAKAITRILSRDNSTSRTGFSKYNRCFDFECDVGGKRKQMIVTSVTGHIMNIDFAESHRHWTSCDPVQLFEAPIIKSINSDKESICQTLRREAKKCAELILWLDCDREGENIAFEVIEICRAANNRLSIKRARFSSLVPREIWHAINNLIAPNSNENDAVDARQEIDLRIGAAFTRFQTLRIQSQTPIDSVVSYGPCQFPTLGFVVDRWLRRQNFVAEPFWTIKVFMSDTIFTWQRNHLFDRRACFLLFEMMTESPLAIVESVQNREKLKYRPLPLETVELQKRCSRYLRLTSHRTMQIAETLYQRGLISYPRTETNAFPTGLNLKNLCNQQRISNKWGHYAQNFVFREPTKGKKKDNAHPPIHPTKFDQQLYDNLSVDEKRVFEFVVLHFLACCSENAKGLQSSVTLNIAGERFSSHGIIVLERNYLEVYKYEQWKNRELVGEYFVNHSFVADDMKMSESKTSCPELLSEEELIALMDANGIGTDATMAQHIETIQTRQYAFKRQSDRKFVPKELGIALCRAYDRMHCRNLSRPNLRANMEQKMKQISEGRLDKNEFLQNCLLQMKQIFVSIQKNAQTLDEAMVEIYGAPRNINILKHNLSRCGKCDQFQTLKSSSNNARFLHCSICSNDLKVPRGTLSGTMLRCPICNFEVLSVQNIQTGKQHNVCPSCFDVNNLRCFQCKYSECSLSENIEVEIKKCNRCNDGVMHLKYVKKLRKFTVGCNQWKAPISCKNTIWFPSMIKQTTKASNQRCQKCSALKIDFVLDPKCLPSGMPSQFIGCCSVHCDSKFAELVEFEANMRGKQMRINSYPLNGNGYLVGAPANPSNPRKKTNKKKNGRGRVARKKKEGVE